MLSKIRLAWRAAFDRGGVETEMEKEMRLHVEMETESNIRRGMAPAEARRVALVAFGGIEKAKEATRDERSTQWVEQLHLDLRFAVRGMRQRPGFTAAIITLLALGTGANTAIFSAVDEMVLRPFPIPGGDRVVSLVATAGSGEFEFTPPHALIDAWHSRARLVEEFVTYRWDYAVLGDTTRVPAREVEGLSIGPGATAFASMRPALGRDILPADTSATAPPVVMLSHKLWRSDFGGRPDVVGSTLLLNGESHTIIGVAPPDFFVPFASGALYYMARRHQAKPIASGAIAKLRPGYTLEDANREVAPLATLLSNTSGLKLEPPKLKDGTSLTRPRIKNLVLVLFGAVGLVLLIACANVANLLLARTWARQREFAVRGAIGAGKGRIARQLFTENLLLALIGGLTGFALAIVLVRLMVLVQPDNVGLDGRIDLPVFGWAMAISVATGLLLAAAPTLFIGDGRLSEMLKSSVRSSTTSRGAARVRSTLVVAEVALSVILLVGSGLLIRSIVAMQRAEVGIQPEGLAAMGLIMPGKGFAESPERRAAVKSVLARVRQTPGIASAAFALTGPPDFGVSLKGDMEVEGAAITDRDSLGAVAFNQATDGFFKTAGMRFIEGRPFDEAAGKTEVVINERFARRFWPDGAIGKRVRLDSVWATVVGVVANTEIPGEKGLPSGLQHYRPIVSAFPKLSLIVRSNLSPPLLESTLRDAVKASAPAAKVADFEMAGVRYVEARAIHRFTLGLIAVFAGLALVLAAIGLGAVIGYSVSQRMREIGIRIALGAQTSEVARLVLRQGVMLAAIGIALGCLGGLGATRLIRSMLYGVTPGDPLTMFSVALLLLFVAVIACAMPARRATRVDPVEMVRAD